MTAPFMAENLTKAKYHVLRCPVVIYNKKRLLILAITFGISIGKSKKIYSPLFLLLFPKACKLSILNRYPEQNCVMLVFIKTTTAQPFDMFYFALWENCKSCGLMKVD